MKAKCSHRKTFSLPKKGPLPAIRLSLEINFSLGE